jgi:type IV secretion system protein VirD4
MISLINFLKKPIIFILGIIMIFLPSQLMVIFGEKYIDLYLITGIPILEKKILTVLYLSACVFGFVALYYPKIQNKIGGGKQKKLGSASFKSGRDFLQKEGAIIGKMTKGNKVDYLRFNGSGHLMTIAPTRSGKGVSAIIPNLLDYPHSVIVTDPKGENYAITQRRRKEMGSTVLALDPFAVVEKNGAKFNPLDLINPSHPDALDECRSIADLLVYSNESSADTEYFNNEAKSLLTGLIFFASTLPKTQRNLLSVRAVLELPEDDLKEFMEIKQNDTSCPPLKSASARFLQKADKERSAVLSTAQNHTHFLESPRMRTILSASTVNLDQLGSLSLSIFLILPPHRLDSYARWLRLMVGSITLSITSKNKKTEHPVLFLLDEFANLGKMELIKKAYSLMAGYGLNLWAFLQDLNQLKALYKDNWETFLGNSDIIQFFGTNDFFTAEYASKLIGDTTVYAENSGHNKSGKPTELFGSKSVGQSEQARKLLNPDEIRRLDQNKILIVSKGQNPVMASKPTYYKDKFFKDKFDSSGYN